MCAFGCVVLVPVAAAVAAAAVIVIVVVVVAPGSSVSCLRETPYVFR